MHHGGYGNPQRELPGPRVAGAGSTPLAGHISAVVIISLGLIGAIWPLTMDLYLPSFVQL